MAKHEFHIYASTKTTAQLVLDLAAAVSHGFTLFVLMNFGPSQRTTVWDVLFYLVIVTMALQGILAVGLFSLRMMAVNHGGNIPRAAKHLNNLGFWACLVVAFLEVGIAAIEKLVLDGKHQSSNQNCPALTLTSNGSGGESADS